MSQISALKRITTKEQQNCIKFSQILLKKDIIQVYIGRDIECNYRISSIEISRKHALIEYSVSEDFWLISDLNSTNGLFVNAVQLSSYSPLRLADGDRVSFGPPNQSQFLYQFIDNYNQNNNNNNCISYELSAIGLTTIPVIPIVTRIQTTSTDEPLLTQSLHFDIEPSNQRQTISLTANMPTTRSGTNYSTTGARSSRMSMATSGSGVGVTVAARSARISTGFDRVICRKAIAGGHSRERNSVFVTEHDYSRSHSANSRQTSHSSKNNNKKGIQLKPKDISSSGSKSKGSSKVNESDKEKSRIEKEKKKLDIRAKLMAREKEKDRMKILKREEELNRKEKELSKKERENQKKEQKIEKMKEKLIAEKKELSEKKQKLNQLSNEEVNRDSAKRKLRSDDGSQSSSDIKRRCNTTESCEHSANDSPKRMEDILENEMTCSVCSEYFIRAVILNCSHTFCYHCIEQWKHTSNVCPICRHKIEVQIRSLAMDNTIDNILNDVNPDLKEHRKALLAEREKTLEKKKKESAAAERSSGANRGGFASLLPSLHFFLRQSTNRSDTSDSDSNEAMNVIGFGFDDRYSTSSSISSSSSDDSSDDDSDSDDSSSSDESIASSMSSVSVIVSGFDDSGRDRSLSPSVDGQGLQGSTNDLNDSESEIESVVTIHSDDESLSDSSDDSIFSIDD